MASNIFSNRVEIKQNLQAMTSHSFSAEHLTACLLSKEKYKQAGVYIREVELGHEAVYSMVNQSLFGLLTTSKHPLTAKLFALRFFKDLFLSAQFQLIDGLHEAIFKKILKVCQYDKDNKDPTKRGCDYFLVAEKRKKQTDIEKLSFSFVVFATEIVYAMGEWYKTDENDEETEYSQIYQKLKKASVPFPISDKELKFFKPEERELFNKRYKEWVDKLPNVQEEEEESEEQEKQNHRTSKVRSKQKIPEKGDEREIQSIAQKGEEGILRESGVNCSRDPSLPKNGDGVSKSEDVVKIAHLMKKEQLDLKLISELQEKLIKKQEEEKALRSNIQVLKESHLSQGQRNNLKTQISDLQKRLEEKAAESANRQKALQEQSQQTSALKERQKGQQEEISSLRKKVMEACKSKHADSSSAESYKKELQVCQQMIEKLQKQNISIKSELETKSQQLQKAKKGLSVDWKSPNEDLKTDENKSQESKDEKLNRLQKEQQQMDKQMEQLGEFYGKQISKLKEEIKVCKQENYSLKQDLELSTNLRLSAQKEMQDLRNLLSRKEEELQKVQRKSDSVKQQSNKLRDTAQEREAESVPSQARQSFNETSMSVYLTHQPRRRCSRPQDAGFTENDRFSKTAGSEHKRPSSLGKTEQSFTKASKHSSSHSRIAPYSLHQTGGHSQSNSQVSLLQSTNFGLKKDAVNQKCFNKKSALLIDSQNKRKSQQLSGPYIEDSNTLHRPRIQPVTPFMRDYFSMPLEDSQLFRGLCLIPSKRETPIFTDPNFQVKLSPQSTNFGVSSFVHLLEVQNFSAKSMRVRVLSGHDEVKLMGSKSKVLGPYSGADFRVEAKVKDLNLRYPVVTLMISFMKNAQTSSPTEPELKYHIPLPITLFEYFEVSDSVPESFIVNQKGLKSLVSESVPVNKSISQIGNCFSECRFRRCAETAAEVWEGQVEHRLIENIQSTLRIVHVPERRQVTFQFKYREHDQITEAFCKASLQCLMFLIQ